MVKDLNLAFVLGEDIKSKVQCIRRNQAPYFKLSSVLPLDLSTTRTPRNKHTLLIIIQLWVFLFLITNRLRY